MKKLKVLDLFSGIGGFSLGLHNAGGFETVAFCEIDQHCHKVLKKHWPQTPIWQDVRTLTFNKLQLEGITNKIDVITGGFPCQDISFAGAGKGILKGERSSLWKEYARLIEEVRPKYAIIENVEYLRKNGLGVVLRDLARIGYDCEWACITADSVGYPHQRQRLFLISYPSSQRLDEYFGERRPLHIDEEWPPEKTYSEGEGCEPESIAIRPILSRGAFESLRDASTDRRAAVSKLRRVTNGIPSELDEPIRKQRIKQLGNAIVPEIAEIIGLSIMDFENEKLQH